jgi:hypothetical protein
MVARLPLIGRCAPMFLASHGALTNFSVGRGAAVPSDEGGRDSVHDLSLP